MIRKHLAPLLLSVGLGACLAAGGAEPAFRDVERQFRELPLPARRLTGPLFWLHGDETKAQLEGELQQVLASGNGIFTTESRPHKDWLGEGWYRDLDICLSFARTNNLQMIIFDDWWWPSQMMGGRVPAQYGSKRLEASAVNVAGPKAWQEAGYGDTNLIAVVAGRLAEGEAVDGGSLTNLTSAVKDGALAGNAPDGNWKIMKFTRRFNGTQGGQQRYISVDGASPDCVAWFIKTVYQPHYDRFKKDFGRTIVGYFYDEPETQGDWGSAVPQLIAERKLDLAKLLVGYKFKLAGEEQIAAQYQYLDAFAEAWGRTLYGGLSQWCREHHVYSMGHFMEHENELFSRQLCAGNMMQLQKYSDMGGIDLVCQQFYPGQKRFGLWQMAKLGSSVAHVYNKTDDLAMCEMFGAYGQDITYPQMKWLTDSMQVRGINFMIPHSFNPRAPYDTDCPPFFYNGGFEPRYPLYRVYADYTSRLSLLLSGGRHVCPVAFLFPGQSMHAGRAIRPDDLTTTLQDAQYDCDWLTYDAWEHDARLSGKEIKLHQESYQVLIVPPVEVIPYAVLEKAKQFLERGGVVVGYGFLPSKSATLGKTSADLAALCAAIWGDKPAAGNAACRQNGNGGRAYFLPEKPSVDDMAKCLARDAGIPPVVEVLEGDTGNWLYVLHRVKAGADVFLICNLNHEGAARKFTFRVRAAGVPECWDAMRNEITAVPFERGRDGVKFDLTLEPSESVLLVFRDKSRPWPARRTAAAAPPALVVPVTADPALPAPADPEIPVKPGPLTRSPVKSNIFNGRGILPADVNLARVRVYLELDELAPEAAASITVNGQYAGGFIGKPFRLEVTRRLKPGANAIRIAPFAPAAARLVVVSP